MAIRDMDWDFPELVQENNTQIKSIGFSVDLKLGGLGDFGDGLVKKLEDPRGGSIVSKRKKGIHGTQNVLCLVDECRADLSECREYHRRRRVCERHSKTPVVVVVGKQKRFCQQCSRFQPPGEFDGEKGSCRKHLDGHNRRWRKLQPESFYMTSGNFFSNHQGPRFLQFSVPQSYTTSTVGVVSPLPRVAKQHQKFYATDQHCKIPYSFACNYNGRDKQLPFLLASDPERSNQADAEVPICQRIVNNRGPAETGSQQVLSNSLTQSINSKRGVSLRSTHATRTLVTSSSHLVPQGVIKLNQPIGLHFDLVQYSCSRQTAEWPPILVPQARNSNNLCEAAPDDLLEKGASQVLPFS